MFRPHDRLFAEVVLFRGPDRTLHYEVPSSLRTLSAPGKRVLAPLGRREVVGVIIHLVQSPPEDLDESSLRSLFTVLDKHPVILPDLLDLCLWISRYYFHPLREVIQLAVPDPFRKPPKTFIRLLTHDSGASGTPLWSELLKNLPNKDTIPLSNLKRKMLLDANTRRDLRELEQGGLLELVIQTDDPLPTKKDSLTLRLLDSNFRERIKRRSGLQLVELIEANGGILPLAHAKTQIKQWRYWISKLANYGIIKIEDSQQGLSSQADACHIPLDPFELSDEQKKIVETITTSIRHPVFKPYLVFGVTGSGKTEIYLRLVERALEQDKGSLILVPEISLTQQMESAFHERLGSQLAVWHSGVSKRDRIEQWKDLMEGKRKVVLGARSAVFIPVPKPGLIIVDEEHDSSYKQDDHLRYQARDVALMRAKLLGIPIVLGSATPSLQTLYHCINERYSLFTLPRRISNSPPPSIEVVDMKREKRSERIFSKSLKEALKETYEAGQQALLFLNRRGFATFALCSACGEVLQCSSCSVSLTFHQDKDMLCCHYCGTQRRLPGVCPRCREGPLALLGFGTERIEKEVKLLLPDAEIVRIDRDSVATPDRLNTCLEMVRQNRAHVLIGTQMISKGHHFPNLTLVGVVNADSALQVPDFRSGESCVQLLMQVAGRAGRGDLSGRVIIQTYNPSHYTIESVVKSDYMTFAFHELESRKNLLYPPYVRMVRFLATSPEEESAACAAQELAFVCRQIASESPPIRSKLAILGPSPAPLVKLKNRFRYHLFVKSLTARDLQEFVEEVLKRSQNIARHRHVHLAVDRDPIVGI